MDSKQSNLIPGYSHPTHTISSRGRMYKTFSEGSKPKKKEKFGNTTLDNQYLSSKDLRHEEKIEHKCPSCDELANKICNCSYNDKTCPKGHIWYTDREGNIKVGNPH